MVLTLPPLDTLQETYRGLTTEGLMHRALTQDFPSQIAMVSSFGTESAVLLHLMAQVNPALPVLFLDTEKLFPETLEYVQTLTQHLSLTNVHWLKPDPLIHQDDPDGTLYRAAYFEHFPGVWRHGDWAEITAHDGLTIHGRSDATLNPGGVRIGTAEIYRQVEQIPAVLESLVIEQRLGLEGDDSRVVLFVRLREGERLTDELQRAIRQRIREHASPHHVPKVIVAVADIPRTISGKITELAVRDLVHGRPVKNAEALANPAALALFRDLPELRF